MVDSQPPPPVLTCEPRVWTDVTANRVTGQELSTASIKSVDDALKRGLPICTLEATRQDLLTTPRFARLEHVAVAAATSADIYDMMDDGTCAAAFMEDYNWMLGEAGQYATGHAQAGEAMDDPRQHCRSKTQLPEVLLSSLWAYPLRDDLSLAFSWAITELVNDGTFDEIDQEERALVDLENKCDESASVGGSGLAFKMHVSEGLGPCLLVYATCISAALLHLIFSSRQAKEVSSRLARSATSKSQGLDSQQL